MTDHPDSPDTDKTLVSPTPGGSKSENDETVLRSSSDSDKTKIQTSPQARGGHVAADDKTIIASRSDAVDDDKTVLASGPREGNDKTVIARRGGQDKTVLVGSNTVLVGRRSVKKPPPVAPDEPTIAIQSSSSDQETRVLDDDNDDATIINSGDGGETRADNTYIASLAKNNTSKGNTEAGRLLKNRFVLEERIGSGGMGDVYKALDLRQQEAQERNPYIAIKILNENFARHKDAFISLQREATRTRGIPHPNIMGVYDFDREGDTVFMSMELLDGKPLDDFLKQNPEGVSREDALNIIDGICKGLSRAHDAGIVHSDFKPGNIYYCTDKSAKVFDFGIARAVANPNDIEADGEQTVFDAGTLSALTPTYASFEMMNGEKPTKADDVYAVALVAYELFTGKHPYNRTPADKALAQGLKPEPVPNMKARHWRALSKALALKSEDRTQSIDEFQTDFFSEDPPYVRYGLTAAVVLGAIGFGIYAMLFGGAPQLPEEMTRLQGVLDVNANSVRERLERPNFESGEWRDSVSLALDRVRLVDGQLEEKYAEILDDIYSGTGNRRQEIDNRIDGLESRTLSMYLAEAGRLRDEGAVYNPLTNVPANNEQLQVQLRRNIERIDATLVPLNQAGDLLEYARQNHDYDSQAIAAVAGPVEALVQSRLQIRQSYETNLARAVDNAEAARLAAIERARIEDQRLARNTSYLQDRERFKTILKCKGDLADAEVAEIGSLLRSMGQRYPAQYALDVNGMATALAGCIEQRIGVRLPDRARKIKSQVMTFLPDQSVLADIEIDDLDPCAARNLEGQGVRNRSWCSDKLAVGDTGPEMVVIPAKPGTEIQKFAISRVEISVSDYNLFCEQTGCTRQPGAGSLPVTNITLSQALGYLDWLADQSGKSYRLPTPQEWLHAASTNTAEAIDENVNCSVDSRGVRLGDKLLNALSGRPNSWGLYNHIGNAREWVMEGDTVLAVGGAHTDPRAECTLNKRVPHNGSADSVTGFRIMRQVAG